MDVVLKQREFCLVGHPHFLVAAGALIICNHAKPTAPHCEVLPTMRTGVAQEHMH